jgi:hypothetical protein
MPNRFGLRFCYSLFVFAVGLNTSALADEGMWLFNAPPLKQLKEKYQFEPTSQWLEHCKKPASGSTPAAAAHSCLRMAW